MRGLRYPVHHMPELPASDMTDAEILTGYEDLEANELRPCQS